MGFHGRLVGGQTGEAIQGEQAPFRWRNLIQKAVCHQGTLKAAWLDLRG